MSAPPPQPVLPLNALPPRPDAGDTLAFAAQTALPLGDETKGDILRVALQ